MAPLRRRVAAIALVGCLPAALAAAERGAGEDWSTLQHDMRRSGYTTVAPEPPYRYRWVWVNGDRLDPEAFESFRKKARDQTNTLPLELFPAFTSARFNNFAQPMVRAGTAYIGSVEGDLFAIDVETGRTKWRRKASGGIFHCATVAAEAVFVGTLRGLDAFGHDGTRKWSFVDPHYGSFRSCPAAAGGLVLSGSTSGHFFGLDAETGKARWEYDAGAPIYQSPVVHDGRVYFGSENMHFHCLDAATGKSRWVNEKIYGLTFWHYWPVIAAKAGVVMFQTHCARGIHASGCRLVEKAPKDYEKTQRLFREYLEANPHLQTFFVLDLADGKQRFKMGTGQAGFCHDLMPPPIVRADGTAFSYHYAQQGTFQENGRFHGYSHPVDFGIIDFQTGTFRRTGPVGSNRCPVLCRNDDFHQTTMGGKYLFGLQAGRAFGCTSIGQARPVRWSVPFWWSRRLTQGYYKSGKQGMIAQFHWGGAVGGTILKDVVLVNPMQGVCLIAYESKETK